MPDSKSFFKTEGFIFFLRLFAWAIFFAAIFIIKSFFNLIFLTFVFSYLQSLAEKKLKPKITNRRIRVLIVAGFFLTVLVSVGSLFVPLVIEQAKLTAERYPIYVAALDKEVVKLSKRHKLIEEFLKSNGNQNKSPSAALLQMALDDSIPSDKNEEYIASMVHFLKNTSSKLLSMGSAFLLSLLFSFLIVFDLPRIKQGVVGLRKSRLQFIYDEVAPGITKFGEVLGQTLTAQLFIAIANTVLTAASIYILGIGDKVAFLSIIVFFCSFIPVAGVFISSVPICIFALSAHGFSNLLLAVFLILLIHMIEAYILNPKIYSQHLKLNPVFVLIILTIAGKLFHAWGLILGLPVCTYFFKHAIRDDELEAK